LFHQKRRGDALVEFSAHFANALNAREHSKHDGVPPFDLWTLSRTLGAEICHQTKHPHTHGTNTVKTVCVGKFPYQRTHCESHTLKAPKYTFCIYLYFEANYILKLSGLMRLSGQISKQDFLILLKSSKVVER